jgi:hypothetical protein
VSKVRALYLESPEIEAKRKEPSVSVGLGLGLIRDRETIQEGFMLLSCQVPTCDVATVVTNNSAGRISVLNVPSFLQYQLKTS